MKQKNILLKQIDEAINRESTSPENRILFTEIKEELVQAKTKGEYAKVILKIVGAIGAVAKLGSTLNKIFSNSG